jgi:hypothetical protein
MLQSLSAFVTRVPLISRMVWFMECYWFIRYLAEMLFRCDFCLLLAAFCLLQGSAYGCSLSFSGL